MLLLLGGFDLRLTGLMWSKTLQWLVYQLYEQDESSWSLSLMTVLPCLMGICLKASRKDLQQETLNRTNGPRFSPAGDCLRSVLRREGLWGFYRSMPTTMAEYSRKGRGLWIEKDNPPVLVGGLRKQALVSYSKVYFEWTGCSLGGWHEAHGNPSRFLAEGPLLISKAMNIPFGSILAPRRAWSRHRVVEITLAFLPGFGFQGLEVLCIWN